MSRYTERLIAAHYLLTRKQIRKVSEMGGSAWLGKIISEYVPTQQRTTIEAIRAKVERNRDIIHNGLTSRECAKKHNLSIKRVQQIRRESKA
jgi:signal recognition particle GTPase